MKTAMLGAIIGDIAGSTYEHHNIKEKPDHLIGQYSRFTDDTVLTLAVADGIVKGIDYTGSIWLGKPQLEACIRNRIRYAVLEYARKYPGAGYGGRFRAWMREEAPEPYNSLGNGSAMRASFCGWASNSEEEALALAKLSAEITHNHPDGIKGAQAVALSVYLLRQGISKEDLKARWADFYTMDFTLDQIRPTYRFSSGCNGSVPQALEAFYEGQDFEDVIKLAISIGGDSDTIAAIAGSLAEVIYEVPEELAGRALNKLDTPLVRLLQRISEKYGWNRDVRFPEREKFLEYPHRDQLHHLPNAGRIVDNLIRFVRRTGENPDQLKGWSQDNTAPGFRYLSAFSTLLYQKLKPHLETNGLLSERGWSNSAALIQVLCCITDVLTVTDSYYACNDGMVDSFGEHYHSPRPLYDSYNVLREHHVKTHFIIRRLEGHVIHDLEYQKREDLIRRTAELIDLIRRRYPLTHGREKIALNRMMGFLNAMEQMY